MARIVLVTGGCRSGKSEYARRMGESLPGPRAYVATCPVLDDEMRARIEKHARARADGGWETIEETVELARAIENAGGRGTVLVDCLTLWINNLMYESERDGDGLTEELVESLSRDLLAACSGRSGTVIFVTNEVGLGVVPDNVQARLYRDLVGRCNQIIAEGADELTLVCCGIPIHLKKGRVDGTS